MKQFSKVLSLVVLFVMVLAVPSFAVLDTWTVWDSFNGYNLYGAVYTADTHLAVGAYNKMIISGNGSNWSALNQGKFGTPQLNTVNYCNNTYFTGGASGTLMWSADSIVWTKITTGTGNAISNITCGNGYIVAITVGGDIFTSQDGLLWAKTTVGVGNGLFGATFNPETGLFVIVGAKGGVWVSYNATSWTKIAVPTTNNLASVAYGNGTYIAVGYNGTVLVSYDALTWTPTTYPYSSKGLYANPKNITSIAYGNGYFVASPEVNGILTVTVDGINWDIKHHSNMNSFPKGVAFGNGYFVVVGEYGMILQSEQIGDSRALVPVEPTVAAPVVTTFTAITTPAITPIPTASTCDVNARHSDLDGGWDNITTTCVVNNGCKVNGNYRIHNRGAEDSHNSRVRVYMSSKPNTDDDHDWVLLHQVATGMDRAGESKSKNIVVNTAKNISLKGKYLIVVTDDFDDDKDGCDHHEDHNFSVTYIQ